MAIPWITALKLVPWGDVIEAAPQVIKAAKGLIRKKDADAQREEQVAAAAATAERIAPPTSSGELALQQIQLLQGRVELLEQSQRQSLEIIEVQSGSYLGEDDIVRFDDAYGRAKPPVSPHG